MDEGLDTANKTLLHGKILSPVIGSLFEKQNDIHLFECHPNSNLRGFHCSVLRVIFQFKLAF